MSRPLRTIFVGVPLFLLALGLAGCSSTIHKQSYIGGVNTLSLDAKQRLVLFGKDPYTGRTIVCAEPSPDALVAISAAIAGQGSGTPQGGNPITAALSGASSESAASIGLRTSTIQTLRDGYYRLCEGYLNGVVTREDYYSIVRGIDVQMAAMMSFDALSGMRAAPGVAISGGTVTASADGTTRATAENPAPETPSADAKAASGGNILLSAPSITGTAYQAVAISNVFNRMMDYKERGWSLRRPASGDTAAQPIIRLPPCPADKPDC